MTIAVPLFGTRVSPRFDCTSQVLLVELEDGRLVSRRTVTLPTHGALAMAGLMREQSVEVLICGGISCHLAGLVSGFGVNVISGVIGESQDALDAYIAGTLRSGDFGRGFRRRGRHGNKRWLREF